MPTKKKKKKSAVKKKSNKRVVRKKSNSGLDKIQSFISFAYVIAIIAFVYVVFFMPTNTTNNPVDNSGNSNVVQNDPSGEFNLYHYLNKATAGRGTLEYDFTFALNDGNVLKVSTLQNFITKGGNTSIVGSTTYDWNSNSAVIDDFTYLSGGYRYERTSSGYVKTENKNNLDAGNMNIGKISDGLVKEDETVKEDGIECNKYTGVVTYGDLSTAMRNYVRAEGVNIGDINNLQLSIDLFVTVNGLPYKLVVSIEDANCMVKSSNLNQKNGKLSGTLTITMAGFNGTDPVELPSEIESATEGTYIFTDKVSRFLNNINM